MESNVRVVGISGSLRKGSYNTALLHGAAEVVPDGMTLELADDLRALPLYDEDLRTAGAPESVTRFRAKLAAADALLIVTPEYNYSVPGVLKNAIDWASRAPSPPLDDKPLAIMGASPGILGTARCQYHLRQIAVFLNMHVVNRPEVFVTKCADKIKDGRLVDEPTRKIVSDLLVALRDFTLRLQRGKPAIAPQG